MLYFGETKIKMVRLTTTLNSCFENTIFEYIDGPEGKTMRVTRENGGDFISFYTLKLIFVAMELIFWIILLFF